MAAVTLISAATDVVVQDIKYNASQQERDSYETWENVYSSVQFLTLSTAGITIIQKLAHPNAFYKLTHSIKSLGLKLNNLPANANSWLLGLRNSLTGVQGAGKVSLLSKLSNYSHLSSWVNNLDEVADAALISKLDNLATTNPNKLSQLDDLYNPSKFQMTAGANRIPLNSPAPFSSTINGKTVQYNSQGFPDFKPHSAGSSFEFKSNSLTGKGSATSGDFLAANNWTASNPALAGKFQIIPGSQKCLVKFGDDWI